MEFNEKLQQLRKDKGLTQEELAQMLYVSRTAVSKWESGRGCPNIESLKDISEFFCVSIDELLSGEKLLSLAEKEKRADIRRLCSFLWGFADMLSILLIFLPLYPSAAGDTVYAVSIFHYEEGVRTVYLALFVLLFLAGVLGVIFPWLKIHKGSRIISAVSLILGIGTVLVLALGRVPYAVVTAFLLLLLKAFLLCRCIKAEGR